MNALASIEKIFLNACVSLRLASLLKYNAAIMSFTSTEIRAQNPRAHFHNAHNTCSVNQCTLQPPRGLAYQEISLKRSKFRPRLRKQ